MQCRPSVAPLYIVPTQARGLPWSLYSVDGREDTFTAPLTAKSLLRPKEDTRPKEKCVLLLYLHSHVLWAHLITSMLY